jgi:enoyl-CoA hydratase/carnithine racemase
MNAPMIKLSDLSVERLGAVAFIRIDLGTPVNAVRPETMRQLLQVLQQLEEDREVRAIILGHAGKHFVGGADFAFLQQLKTATAEQIEGQIYEVFQGAVRALYACPKPTVAAIGGAALTVGCEAALACDFRLVTERASFQESWIKLGLMPPLGGVKKLPALVGYGAAADMILRGRAVGGAEAVALGLANRLVAQEELEAEAIALARELAAGPPLAYAAAKRALHEGLEQSFGGAFAASIRNQVRLIQSADFREGVDAVVEKRPPRFRGE